MVALSHFCCFHTKQIGMIVFGFVALHSNAFTALCNVPMEVNGKKKERSNGIAFIWWIVLKVTHSQNRTPFNDWNGKRKYEHQHINLWASSLIWMYIFSLILVLFPFFRPNKRQNMRKLFLFIFNRIVVTFFNFSPFLVSENWNSGKTMRPKVCLIFFFLWHGN